MDSPHGQQLDDSEHRSWADVGEWFWFDIGSSNVYSSDGPSNIGEVFFQDRYAAAAGDCLLVFEIFYITTPIISILCT